MLDTMSPDMQFALIVFTTPFVERAFHGVLGVIHHGLFVIERMVDRGYSSHVELNEGALAIDLTPIPA